MPLQEQDKVFINPITVEKNGRILEEETIEISIKKKKIKEHSILRSEYIDTIIDTASLHPSSMVAIATNKVKDYPEFATFKEAEIYLLGLILTDAYYTKTGGIEIYQSAKKKFIPEKITEALDSLGYKYSFAERDRGGKQFTWRIAKESADHFKELFYGQVTRGTADGRPPTKPFPGFCHFPIDYDSAHYRQLMAEELVDEILKTGARRRIWKQIHGRRNEALDCRVYALAALFVVQGIRKEGIEKATDRKYGWKDFWAELLASRGL